MKIIYYSFRYVVYYFREFHISIICDFLNILEKDNQSHYSLPCEILAAVFVFL